MLTLTFDAIFEQGAFRPLKPFSESSIPEGQTVRLRVEPVELPNEVLQLATSVYAGLSEQEITEIEKIILNREHFFDLGDVLSVGCVPRTILTPCHL